MRYVFGADSGRKKVIKKFGWNEKKRTFAIPFGKRGSKKSYLKLILVQARVYERRVPELPFGNEDTRKRRPTRGWTGRNGKSCLKDWKETSTSKRAKRQSRCQGQTERNKIYKEEFDPGSG